MPGSCTSPRDLKTTASRLAIALERVGWSLSIQTGHEPIHQFPPRKSLNFNEPNNDCVTHQTRDVVNIQALH